MISIGKKIGSAMPDKRSGDVREPKFYIDKKQGLRHLLHSAIRMTLDEEDAFAINMLAQAADKVLLDMLKHARIDDPTEFEDRIVPEHRSEFFSAYRRTFNFLKHAKKDYAEQLPVYDLVAGNEFLLFFNVIRYHRLFSEYTTHMQFFFACATLLHPKFIKWQNMGEVGRQFVDERKRLEHLSRNDAMRTIRQHCYENGKFLKERADDLRLVNEANHVLLSGEPGPKRLRIPFD
jgi:hypothetical protein